MRSPEESNPQRQKAEQGLPGVGGGVDGDRVSVWDDEKALETNTGDDYTTLRMCIMALNCTLKYG